jgi:hypothetical protein
MDAFGYYNHRTFPKKGFFECNGIRYVPDAHEPGKYHFKGDPPPELGEEVLIGRDLYVICEVEQLPYIQTDTKGLRIGSKVCGVVYFNFIRTIPLPIIPPVQQAPVQPPVQPPVQEEEEDSRYKTPSTAGLKRPPAATPSRNVKRSLFTVDEEGEGEKE